MRVKSSLADIQFRVGDVTREADYLYINSAPGSTLETQIRISPRDARETLWRLLTQPAVWGFIPRILFSHRDGAVDAGSKEAWDERRRRVGINKPW